MSCGSVTCNPGEEGTVQRAAAIPWWQGVTRRRDRAGAAPWEGRTVLLCLLWTAGGSSADGHRKERRAHVLKTSVCSVYPTGDSSKSRDGVQAQAPWRWPRINQPAGRGEGFQPKGKAGVRLARVLAWIFSCRCACVLHPACVTSLFWIFL